MNKQMNKRTNEWTWKAKETMCNFKLVKADTTQENSKHRKEEKQYNNKNNTPYMQLTDKINNKIFS